MFEEAYELAARGLSNADIFGQLELTSGALMALLQTKPKLLFQILKGREKYCTDFRNALELFAGGEEPLTRVQYAAITYLLERAEAQSKQLIISHEMVLLAGQGGGGSDEDVPDTETVTALLRKR